MKILISCLCFLFSFGLQAKDIKSFNEELIKGVQKDLRTDNDQSLKKKDIVRAPASVESETVHPEDLPQDEQKIHKMNIKQLGPSRW